MEELAPAEESKKSTGLGARDGGARQVQGGGAGGAASPPTPAAPQAARRRAAAAAAAASAAAAARCATRTHPCRWGMWAGLRVRAAAVPLPAAAAAGRPPERVGRSASTRTRARRASLAHPCAAAVPAVPPPAAVPPLARREDGGGGGGDAVNEGVTGRGGKAAREASPAWYSHPSTRGAGATSVPRGRQRWLARRWRRPHCTERPQPTAGEQAGRGKAAPPTSPPAAPPPPPPPAQMPFDRGAAVGPPAAARPSRVGGAPARRPPGYTRGPQVCRRPRQKSAPCALSSRSCMQLQPLSLQLSTARRCRCPAS